MDAVKEPGSQPARQASRPVPCSQYECGPADVEAYQCRAEAVSISLWCYSPLIAPWGPRRSEYVTFALLFWCFFFFPFPPQYVVQNVSGFPSQPETKPLTSVGHFILVCNIVYVPIVALYHVYRRKKCIGYVISRYLKAWWWSGCIRIIFPKCEDFYFSRWKKSDSLWGFF